MSCAPAVAADLGGARSQSRDLADDLGRARRLQRDGVDGVPHRDDDMPVYEGGAIYSQTPQAQQTVGQRRSQLDDARRAAVQTADQSWATLQATRSSLTSFAAAVRAAQIALAGLQHEALMGTRTVLDVLVGEQQLFVTQQQLVNAQHDAAVAEFNVAAAVGRLIAPELKLPVPLFEMDRHYQEVRDKWIGFAGALTQ
jgi:outer membrane protein